MIDSKRRLKVGHKANKYLLWVRIQSLKTTDTDTDADADTDE